MEKLIVLGTGNASVTKCYNTCSIIQDKKGRYFMIDAGGGNGILTQLEKMNIPVTEIHDIFLTHEHTDHLLGMIWMIRVIGQAIQKGKYEGNCTIYCHDGLVNVLKTICELTLVKKITKLIGDRIILCPVQDGDCLLYTSIDGHYLREEPNIILKERCVKQTKSRVIILKDNEERRTLKGE